MFNDLNQTTGAQPKESVDDIFAETDKATEAKKFTGYYSEQTAPSSQPNPTEIETQKAGLSSAEDLPTSKKGKIIKIGLIVLLVILLLSLGYLVYAKLIAGKSVDQNVVTPAATTTDISSDVASTTSTETVPTGATKTIPVSEEVPVIPSQPVVTTTPPVSNLTDTDGDGLTDEEEAVLGTDPTKKDTDGDGLTDYEEVKIYNTDPLKVDTDGDGLPDYEEVKIYHTDPLKADTDGDGYSDGQEVKTGNNPLGAGKMTDEQKNAATTVLK